MLDHWASVFKFVSSELYCGLQMQYLAVTRTNLPFGPHHHKRDLHASASQLDVPSSAL